MFTEPRAQPGRRDRSRDRAGEGSRSVSRLVLTACTIPDDKLSDAEKKRSRLAATAAGQAAMASRAGEGTQ